MHLVKNAVSLPHLVMGALSTAYEMVLTDSWKHVFPDKGEAFAIAQFLNNPQGIAKKVIWDNFTDSEDQFGGLDLYDMRFVCLQATNNASMTLMYRRPSKIHREERGIPSQEWELTKVQLVSSPLHQPVRLAASINFPKRKP